jgi:8-oxo-dGTP diphosphatase
VGSLAKFEDALPGELRRFNGADGLTYALCAVEGSALGGDAQAHVWLGTHWSPFEVAGHTWVARASSWGAPFLVERAADGWAHHAGGQSRVELLLREGRRVCSGELPELPGARWQGSDERDAWCGVAPGEEGPECAWRLGTLGWYRTRTLGEVASTLRAWARAGWASDAAEREAAVRRRVHELEQTIRDYQCASGEAQVSDEDPRLMSPVKMVGLLHRLALERDVASARVDELEREVRGYQLAPSRAGASDEDPDLLSPLKVEELFDWYKRRLEGARAALKEIREVADAEDENVSAELATNDSAHARFARHVSFLTHYEIASGPEHAPQPPTVLGGAPLHTSRAPDGGPGDLLCVALDAEGRLKAFSGHGGDLWWPAATRADAEDAFRAWAVHERDCATALAGKERRREAECCAKVVADAIADGHTFDMNDAQRVLEAIRDRTRLVHAHLDGPDAVLAAGELPPTSDRVVADLSVLLKAAQEDLAAAAYLNAPADVCRGLSDHVDRLRRALDALTGAPTEDLRVGVGVAVLAHGPRGVLVGRRLGSHGAGTWSLPGGHLRRGETLREACAREFEEETGIALSAEAFTPRPELTTLCDDPSWPRGYATLYCAVELPAGTEPELREPDKCGGWRWVERLSEAPGALFRPLAAALPRIEDYEAWVARGAPGL